MKYGALVLFGLLVLLISCADQDKKTDSSNDNDLVNSEMLDDEESITKLQDWSTLKSYEYIIQSDNPHWFHAIININEYKVAAENIQVYKFGEQIGRKELLPDTYQYLLLIDQYFGKELLFVSAPRQRLLRTERYNYIDMNIESVFSHTISLNNQEYYTISIVGSSIDGRVSNSFVYYPEFNRFIQLKRIKKLQETNNYNDFIESCDQYFSEQKQLIIDSVAENAFDANVSSQFIHIEGDEQLLEPDIKNCDNHIYYMESEGKTPYFGNTLFRNWSIPEMNLIYTPIDKTYEIGEEINIDFHGITEIGFRRKDSVDVSTLEFCAVTYWDICTKVTDGLMSLDSYTLSGKDEVVSVFGYDADDWYNYIVVISRTGDKYFTNIYQETCGASGCCSLWEVQYLDDEDNIINFKCKTYGEFLEEFPIVLEKYGDQILY